MTDSANLNLVRSIYAAWERGDFSSADWAHPEIEFVFADGPAPGRWTGLEGLADRTRDFLTTWDELRNFAEEYRELDDERVLVLVNLSGRGKSSGVELGQMQTKAAALFHVREGKVTRNVHYFDRERALADLGLSPEGENSNASGRTRIAPAVDVRGVGTGGFDGGASVLAVTILGSGRNR